MLTSDSWILDIVRGFNIEFETLPIQTKLPNSLPFNKQEFKITESEVQQLLLKKVIEKTYPCENNFYSNILFVQS